MEPGHAVFFPLPYDSTGSQYSFVRRAAYERKVSADPANTRCRLALLLRQNRLLQMMKLQQRLLLEGGYVECDPIKNFSLSLKAF
jgi:hypothetical protein